jgi:hypothetical protein
LIAGLPGLSFGPHQFGQPDFGASFILLTVLIAIWAAVTPAVWYGLGAGGPLSIQLLSTGLNMLMLSWFPSSAAIFPPVCLGWFPWP